MVTVGTVTRLYPTGAVWRNDIYVKLLKWFENVMRALRHVTIHTETLFEACFARSGAVVTFYPVHFKYI